MMTNNGDTCVAACLRGTGLQLQPTFLVARELASGQLVEVLPRYSSVTLGIYAVYPSRKFVVPKVRALVEFLSASLAAADWAEPGRDAPGPGLRSSR
jgi:DNA-binding transcriptional LysR family regulator